MSSAYLPSIEAVAQTVANGSPFGYALKDFLEGFYANPSPDKLRAEPAKLAEILRDGGKADAYLAAVGDHLSRANGWRRPPWVRMPERVLSEPFFAARTHELRMILLEESPPAFRERNLFVSANALSRA